MRTRRLPALLGLVAAVALGASPLLAGPADAAPAQAAPPTIPIDQLKALIDPLQPVLELVSPVVYPACADAVIATVLPSALGVDLPPILSTVLGPVLVLCGSVPEPSGNGRVCALDAQAQELLADLTKPILGAALPIEVAPVKALTGFVANVVDALDVPALRIGAQVDAVLQCSVPPGTTTTTTPGSTTTAPTDTTAPPAVDLSGPSFEPPTFEQLQTLPALDPEPPLPAAPAATVTAPRIRYIDQPRFRYPIVMGLPIAFLALVVFFGRALTRPLDAGPRGGTG